MSILCWLFGHDYYEYSEEAMDYYGFGALAECLRCGKEPKD